MSEGLAIVTVTYDSASELPAYVTALERLDPADRPSQHLIVDCASSDQTVAIARDRLARLPWPAELIALPQNAGFAGGMNVAIGALADEITLVLALNPDAHPRPGSIAALREAYREIDSASFPLGAVTARLVRPPDGEGRVLLDACGMRLARSWRHLDRGSGELDRGQYASREEVFGGTGAGTLFVRRALDDCRFDGEVFLEDFHSYREDAELCFRLRERRWRVVYEPSAVLVHRRTNLPQRRRRMSREINAHSLKNRYLLRVLHDTRRSLAMTLVPATARELLILAWVLLIEHSSLWVYGWLWRQRRQLLDRRRRLRARRSAPPGEVEAWFRHAARPLPQSR